MDHKKVNVGIIGAGYWGPNLIRNFSQLGTCNLSYICDVDEKKLASIGPKYPSAKTIKNYSEMLNDPELDAIVIAVPSFLHFSIAKEALNKGKHVLIEKPITSNSNEAKELVALSNQKNKILMVDHTFEYNEAIKKIKEILDSGELGEIFYIRAEWLNLGLLQPDINVIWDLGPHILSMLNFLLNSYPKKASVNAIGYIREVIPEIADIHLKYSNRVSAFVTLSWLEPKKTRRLTIIGSKKLLIFDLTNDEEPIKIYDKSVDLIKEIKDVAQFKVNYKYGEIRSPNIENKEALSNMVSEFIECINSNSKPRSSGESGLRVVQILEAIDKSLKENGTEVSVENDS